MVVVAVIGVLAALAAPNITKRIERVRAEEEAARIQEGLITYRNAARTKRVCVEVRIIFADHRLEPTVYQQGCSTVDGTTILPSVSLNTKRVTLSSLIREVDGAALTTAPNNKFYFTHSGSMLGPAKTEVGPVLLSYLVGGSGRTLRVFPATGIVKERR